MVACVIMRVKSLDRLQSFKFLRNEEGVSAETGGVGKISSIAVKKRAVWCKGFGHKCCVIRVTA